MMKNQFQTVELGDSIYEDEDDLDDYENYKDDSASKKKAIMSKIGAFMPMETQMTTVSNFAATTTVASRVYARFKNGNTNALNELDKICKHNEIFAMLKDNLTYELYRKFVIRFGFEKFTYLDTIYEADSKV